MPVPTREQLIEAQEVLMRALLDKKITGQEYNDREHELRAAIRFEHKRSSITL